MTNCNADSANDTGGRFGRHHIAGGFTMTNTTKQPRHVSDHENREVNGMALTCDRVHENGLEKIEALRKQQKEYLASLPSDPEAGCKAVRKALGDWEDMGAPVAVAKANFIILREVLCHCDVDDYPDLVDALALLAEQGIDAVAKIHQAMKLADDSAGKALGSI